MASFNTDGIYPGIPGYLELDGSNDYASVSTLTTRRNLCPNPLIPDLTGWQQNGALETFERVALGGSNPSSPGFGTTSAIRMVEAGGSTNANVFFEAAATTGVVQRFSAYAYVASGNVRCRVTNVAGTVKAIGATESTTGQWVRIDVTVTPDSTETYRYRIDNPGTAAAEIFVAAVLLETTSELRSYFPTPSQLASGSAGWLGTAHASASDLGLFANGTVRTFCGFAYRESSTGTQALVGGSDTSGAPPRFTLLGGSDTARLRADGSTSVVWSESGISTGQWVHWALAFRGADDEVELFIDGESKGAQAYATNWSAEPGHLTIGAYGSGTAPWNGRMAHFAVFYHELSEATIRALSDARYVE